MLSSFGQIAQFRFNFGKNGKIIFMTDEDEIYKRIGDEIENNNLDKVTWTKAQGSSDGSESRAKSLYIKYRFQKLSSLKKKDEISSLFQYVTKKLVRWEEDEKGSDSIDQIDTSRQNHRKENDVNPFLSRFRISEESKSKNSTDDTVKEISADESVPVFLYEKIIANLIKIRIFQKFSINRMEYFLATLILSVLVVLTFMIVIGQRPGPINIVICFFIYIVLSSMRLVLDVKRLRGIFKKEGSRLVIIALIVSFILSNWFFLLREISDWRTFQTYTSFMTLFSFIFVITSLFLLLRKRRFAIKKS